jgi:hypothetical protein
MRMTSNRSDTSNPFTVRVVVRDECFELPSSLVEQLTCSTVFVSNDHSRELVLDMNPRIFTAYLLFLQSSCFVRPDDVSDKDLLDGLRTCAAPVRLLHHYEHDNVMSVVCSSHNVNQLQDNGSALSTTCFNVLAMSLLFVATCLFSIDLYRQMLVLEEQHNDYVSRLLSIVVYAIDTVLLLFTGIDGIRAWIGTNHRYEQLSRNANLFVNAVSCLGKFVRRQ